MTDQQDRPTNDVSFDERLQQVAHDARKEAEQLPPGEERAALLKRARQAETAAQLNGWLTSPGLQPPH